MKILWPAFFLIHILICNTEITKLVDKSELYVAQNKSEIRMEIIDYTETVKRPYARRFMSKRN